MLLRSFTAFISLSLFHVYSVLCASQPENDAAAPAVLSSVLEVGALAVAADCQRSCFPALNFTMPTQVPSSLDGWWCSMDCEHAFLGFSYEVTGCQSLSQLNADFADMRKNFNARYVRLYGGCDQSGFYDNVIEAAWQNTLGVHALIWFGFTGGNEWQTRRDDLFNTLHNNTKAPFVTRGVQFGSEPLYDDVLSHESLTEQVVLAKILLSDVRIPVTVSELAYGYQERGALDVLSQLDFINAHMLPFFSTEATTGSAAWPLFNKTWTGLSRTETAKRCILMRTGGPRRRLLACRPTRLTPWPALVAKRGTSRCSTANARH